MKKRIIQITAMLLLICTVACMLPNMAVQASAESASFMSVEELQARFPDGKYWNHYVTKESESGDYLWDKGVEYYTVANGQECTDQPCASHTTAPYAARIGKYDCNYFNGGMQCCGFARRLGYLAFGSKVTTWPVKQSTRDYNSIKPGDVIHYYGADADKKWGHWVMVTEISGSTITKAECNYPGNCKIRWGLKLDLKNASRVDVYSAPMELSSSTKHLDVKEGYYVLKNNSTNKILSVAGGKGTSRTNVDLEKVNVPAQLLYISRAKDGFAYKMAPRCGSSGIIINAWGDNPSNGANVNLYKDVSDSTQWWRFDEIPDKGIAIRLASNPSLVLCAEDGNAVVTTYTGAPEQYWTMVSTSSLLSKQNINSAFKTIAEQLIKCAKAEH